MTERDLLAEAYRRVRKRYSVDDFCNMRLDHLIKEIREELQRLKSSRPADDA
jgi:hypothetical protein